MQMWLFGWRNYFGDVWNWVEVLSCITYYIGLGLQHGGSIKCDEAARIFRAFSFMSFGYQVIRYGSRFETFGVLIPVLRFMVGIKPGSHIARAAPYFIRRRNQFDLCGMLLRFYRAALC